MLTKSACYIGRVTAVDADRQRKIGHRRVSPIGFGSMLLTLPHPPPGVHEEPVDEAQAVRTIHAALDGGARLIDTAINYCMYAAQMGRNEALVAKALATWSGDADSVLVVAKGGNRRTDELPFVHDGRRDNLRWSCETSLRALGVEFLGLYMLHAPDPEVPLVESIGALAELQAEGKVEMVGVSNLGRRQLAEAREIVDVVAVENQLSPWSRAALPLARVCAEEGIAFLAWSPLGGQTRAGRLAETYPAIAGIAADHGVSPHQVALAWVLAQAPNVIPIPSARRPETILDSLSAADLRLSPAEIAAIEQGTAA
jgi:aryl-alcohol dehydrogenase-like predicted oxidoreductase